MKKMLILSIPCLFALACRAQKENTSAIIANDEKLTLVSDDYEFTEGPTADKVGNVYFTDQPNDRILKWSASNNTVSEYMSPSGRSNGLYFDREGNLLSAADENNQLWRIAPNKEVTVLVRNYNGKKLNGPNDLWEDPKGGIYFTDPFYKRPWWNHDRPEQTSKRIYYLPLDAETPRIASDENYEQPNGIIGTPDGKKLYVADIGAKKTYVFDIGEDGNLSNKTLFVDMGSDGMTLDSQGNVYLTGDGVTVFNPEGTQIEHIEVPENWTANVTFGGPNKDILFITAMDSLYTLKMKVQGAQ